MEAPDILSLSSLLGDIQGSIPALMETYGVWVYLILFAIIFCETGLVFAPFLPGDSLLFLMGFLAAGGRLNPFILIAVLAAAAILGDSLNYRIGTYFQPASPDLPFPSNETTSPPALTERPTSTNLSLAPGQSHYSFWGLQTATPGPGLPRAWLTTDPGVVLPPVTYWSQPGDTLTALALRFGVDQDQITPAQPISGLLTPGQLLTIPDLLGEAPYSSALLPDSAIIYSPENVGFQIDAFITQAGGYLSTYSEQVDPG